MNKDDFYVGTLCEIVADFSNEMNSCNNECADPGTGSDNCSCEDF